MANGDFLGYCYFKDETGMVLFKIPVLETSYTGSMYSSNGLSSSAGYLTLDMVSPYYSYGGEFSRAGIDNLVGDKIAYSGGDFPRIKLNTSRGSFCIEYLADDGDVKEIYGGTNYIGSNTVVVMVYQPSTGQYAVATVCMDNDAGTAIWTKLYQPSISSATDAAYWPVSIYDTKETTPTYNQNSFLAGLALGLGGEL